MQSEAPRNIVFIQSVAATGGVQFSTLYLAQNLDQTRWKAIVSAGSNAVRNPRPGIPSVGPFLAPVVFPQPFVTSG